MPDALFPFLLLLGYPYLFLPTSDPVISNVHICALYDAAFPGWHTFLYTTFPPGHESHTPRRRFSRRASNVRAGAGVEWRGGGVGGASGGRGQKGVSRASEGRERGGRRPTER
jgi:hypothetical protein